MPSQLPLISVVVPMYNAERTICRTAQSVLDQNYPNLELILVDDGSPDATFDRASTIQDARCRIIRQANAGVSSARNFGLSQSKGEFVLFLDADDTIPPQHLELLVAPMLNDASIGVTFCDVIWVMDRPSGLEEVNRTSFKPYADRIRQGYMLGSCVTSTGSKLFRTEVVVRAGAFYCLMSCPTSSEDADLDLRMAALSNWQFVEGTTLFYLQHEGSASKDRLNVYAPAFDFRVCHAQLTEGTRFWWRELSVCHLSNVINLALDFRKSIRKLLPSAASNSTSFKRYCRLIYHKPVLGIQIVLVAIPGLFSVARYVRRICLNRIPKGPPRASGPFKRTRKAF